MRPMLLIWILIGAVLDDAFAQYTVQVGNVTWAGSPVGYNCFSSTEYPNTVNFTLTKTANGNRTYAVTAGVSSTTGNYNRQLASGPNRLNYQLYTTSARNFVLKAPPSANANEVISGSSIARLDTVIPLSFTFFIPPNQIVVPGTYTDQVTVRVYRRYNDNQSPMDSRTITIQAVVIPGAILSLVPSGSGFSSSTSQNMNFGTLTQGASLGCDLLIRKNTSCRITFNSMNGGVMKAIPVPTPDQVPYSCVVNGSSLDLAAPTQLNLPAGVSPTQDGNRLPVNITIGNPADASTGDYQDQIIITVVAL